MKKKLLKGLFFILLGYLALVALHFIYLVCGDNRDGSYRFGDMDAKEVAMRMEMPAMPHQSAVKNYASEIVQQAVARENRREAQVEQKYEKIGSLTSLTEAYDADEKRARAVIKDHNSLLQEESVINYDGRNVLSLTIGVPPGEFDATVADLKRIGKVSDFHITKTDKTNDFLQLKAKRLSLEKARDALIGIKAQGGKIEELVKLEQEVLSLEGRIQEFGVQLGQFDKVNEFCTVRFSLSETKPVVLRTPYFDYLIASIQWASGIYLLWLGIAAVGLVAIVLLLAIVEKSKLFRAEA